MALNEEILEKARGLKQVPPDMNAPPPLTETSIHHVHSSVIQIFVQTKWHCFCHLPTCIVAILGYRPAEWASLRRHICNFVHVSSLSGAPMSPFQCIRALPDKLIR